MVSDKKECIGILGGTGKEGKGLAYRLAEAGYPVIIGSRQVEKAQITVSELTGLKHKNELRLLADENLSAAQKADLLIITVPYSAHKEIFNSIKDVVNGKIIIDVTVPLVPPKVTRVQMPPAGSASMEAQEILGDRASVVTAFQNISYEKLLSDGDINCDVLVCGQKDARQRVIEIIQSIGLIAWDAGVLENSVVVEGLTSILIGLNKQFGIQSAGIKITGIPG
ncbi:MAG: NADPH-dependent F420 reductase [Anaerolineae bacterium]|nr:NADPH-dependent F420 reductase [Anaerolineae bacterium]